MDNKPHTNEHITNSDAHKEITQGAHALGEKASAEVLAEQSKLTPAQYNELCTVAKYATMAAFPVLAIGYAAEELGEYAAKHLHKK